jgi:CheY-like chemotaxis protein
MSRPSDQTAGHRDTAILVVDDEPALLGLVATMLYKAGYQVLEAPAPSEALRIAAQHPEPIRLLLTDIVMPEMNGYELAERLKAARPETKVLFMSGFTDQALLENTGRALRDAGLIRKPFTQHKLLTRIADLLEEHSVKA